MLIIVNAYGINSATIDSALYARERGHDEHRRHLDREPARPARRATRAAIPSGKDLCDLVDIVVDTKMPLGDAVHARSTA